MKNFSGKALFLDRSDINTDEIIPAKYLTEITKDALKPHLLEDLKMDGFAVEDIKDKNVVFTRENFGCGSSREHAPWAFEVNGINLVIAENYARIFKQNMFNCGMMAVELSKDDIDNIFDTFKGKDTEVVTDFDNKTFVIKSSGDNLELSFSISEYDNELVKADGWVGYANTNY
ncbi:MAG: 3-isopropylmalate dehydratase small subunit [Desulfobacterales bacterium]|nr:3-isopropylmalate dehydratase small subunit [Desulfobacterales bacterium]MCP4160779.1 3-isopropylmalate dehydratase small subunit [Deltaproteobacteria bacterium]